MEKKNSRREREVRQAKGKGCLSWVLKWAGDIGRLFQIAGTRGKSLMLISLALVLLSLEQWHFSTQQAYQTKDRRSWQKSAASSWSTGSSCNCSWPLGSTTLDMAGVREAAPGSSFPWCNAENHEVLTQQGLAGDFQGKGWTSKFPSYTLIIDKIRKEQFPASWVLFQ